MWEVGPKLFAVDCINLDEGYANKLWNMTWKLVDRITIGTSATI
jgi:hypothetical protein